MESKNLIDADKLYNKIFEIENRHPYYTINIVDNSYIRCLEEVKNAIEELIKENKDGV